MTNAMTNLNNTITLTMSSREIAELTGKLHKNVLADSRKMLTELGYKPADFSARYIDGKGESRECFNLPKDLTITLVSGYNVQMRYAITKRWMELEAQVVATPALPTTYLAALKELLKSEKEKETLRLQNEAMKPAAKIGAAVAKLSDQTVTEFVCQLPGVNIMRVQSCLSELGYLKRNSRRQWMVRAPYRDKLFAMATRAVKGPFTFPCVVVLQKGREKLIDLYLTGQLPMKKGFTPDQSIALQI